MRASRPLARKRVLITGGTGSVGCALVRAYASAGCDVAFTYCSQRERAQEIHRTCGAQMFQMDFVQDRTLPVSDFDILVNNAGINISSGLVHEMTAIEIHASVAVNLLAPLDCARQCLPGMIERRWGRIVNINSIFGLVAAQRNGIYTATKHGLSGVTKTLALEYATAGITANEICPGAIESNLMERIAQDQETRSGLNPADYLDSVRDHVPDKRLAVADEVASVALFLCQDEASHINGTSIRVDGGELCAP